MKERFLSLACFAAVFFATALAAQPINLAEDDAAHSTYGGSWGDGKSGGNGFGNWTLTTEGHEEKRHSGFFIATTENNKDMDGIAKEGKAFGIFANGIAFEQAVAYRPFDKPLTTGDSFSFMLESGNFEKKFEQDSPDTGAVGLTLRAGNATSATSDYNKDALFEIGHCEGKSTYQIYDGSDKPDSGVPVTEQGISVTVTLTGDDGYDLEIQTMNDKNVTKLPGRKLSSTGTIESFAVFNRDSEKNDASFNQFQVTREEK